MPSWLCRAGSIQFFSSHPIIILLWQCVCIYWIYYLRTLQCVTTSHSIVGTRLCVTSGGVSLFFSDNRKRDDATTAEHSKLILELLQKRTVLFAEVSTIWENTDGCTDKYHCATALYLLSMIEHVYNIMIDRGVGAPGHGREVIAVLNAPENVYYQS